MDKWKGRVALVTGASAGIGEAVVQKLAAHGMNVVACARNFQKLQQVSEKINEQRLGRVLPVRCDVSVEADVKEIFQQIRKQYGTLHVCINNAGLAHDAPLLTGNLADWKSMLGVNVIGVCLCTKEAVALMDENGVNEGHVIHVNSMSGHRVLPSSSTHFYAATKHAVTALANGLRHELRARKSRIRVSCISPGLVDTEFTPRLFANDPEKAQKVHAGVEQLTAEDIADAIIYALSAPSRVDVNDILVRPTSQAY